jgi:hypothetical protein
MLENTERKIKLDNPEKLTTYRVHKTKKKNTTQYYFIRIDRNYSFGSFEITSIRLYTPLVRGLHGVYNLIEVISS